MGSAVGLLIGTTPTYGIQVILVLLANTALKVNRLAGVVAVHFTNPVTAIPVYWLDYKVGVHFLGQESITWGEFSSQLGGIFSMPFLDALGGLASLGGTVLGPMVFGSLILGSLFGAASYPVLLVLIKRFKEKRALQRARRKLARRERWVASAKEVPSPPSGDAATPSPAEIDRPTPGASKKSGSNGSGRGESQPRAEAREDG